MQKIFSISELNHTLQGLIAANLGIIKVDGEISNFVKPASGHYYFTLKDRKAQIRCVMFKSSNRYLSIVPKNGDKVVVRAAPSLYEPRGELQLVVDHIEAAGLGDLLLKLEKLKQKIRLKGWCDLDKKKPLPHYPKNIAIITSATGAALHDVLNVLKRRAPAVNIVIFPAIVQGISASKSLCLAITEMNALNAHDVCLMVRGGGSIEDLWSFNEEAVIEAVFQSNIPIVCGVGHETDSTLVELVADAVAPTPSAAAEIATQYFPELLSRVKQLDIQLIKNIRQLCIIKTNNYKTLLIKLNALCPEKNIQSNQQRCDDLITHLTSNLSRVLIVKKERTKQNKRLLNHFSPLRKIKTLKASSLFSVDRRAKLVKNILNVKQGKLLFLNEKLATLDPSATLKRGYSITLNSRGEVLTSTTQINDNNSIKTILYDGFITSNIRNIEK